MSTSTSSSTHHPAGRQARARLATYRRYAEIVTEQERALVAGDLETYEALSEATHELQDRIGLAPTPDLVDDPEAGHPAFVDEVAGILRATLAANERIQSRLQGMRVHPGYGVGHGGVEPHHMLGYDATDALAAGSNFNFRF